MSFKIYIGTSGWNYNHWQGIFYPEKLAKNKWLGYYSKHFQTVELNATFYRQPKKETFEGWYKKTPENFIWSVKANKFITHIKRLKDPEESIDTFFSAAEKLKEKLGPVLFQLPPGLAFDEGTLITFLETIKKYNHPCTLEVRNSTWLNDRCFSLLESYNVALCISDTAGRYPYAEEITANFIYIRLHGSEKLYASSYTDRELYIWAEKIMSWQRDTFVYFDNDFGGYAPQNASTLKKILMSALQN